MRGEFGSICDVEVSAATVTEADLDCIGFSIRNISRRVAANDESAALAPKSIDQLTQLVGRVPLKDLVRESTELIEQLCIQSALKLTNNNRASAAEMLGLSRQSLYVKLRRYSLDDENNPAA
jgi:transcriptional regulator PpsR